MGESFVSSVTSRSTPFSPFCRHGRIKGGAGWDVMRKYDLVVRAPDRFPGGAGSNPFNFLYVF